MFTGIVEDLGTVVEWSETGPGEGWLLKIKPDHPELFFKDETALTYVGASVCVSGVCLTVTAFDSSSLEFGVAPETIRRTNFGSFESGKSRVNLERASLASGRNSGHYVQGHVDGVGEVLETWQEKESLWFKIKLPSREFMSGVVPKGFIAVEGTSLTVCHVDYVENWFTLMLIDHTQKHVVIPLRKPGDHVNIECDVMAKYVSNATDHLTSSTRALEEQVRVLQNRAHKLEVSSALIIVGLFVTGTLVLMRKIPSTVTNH